MLVLLFTIKRNSLCLTKYGYSTIGIAAIISFVLIAISIFVENGYVKYPILILGYLS